MNNIYEKKSALERQNEVLIEALERASHNNGLFLNPNYKLKPHFYNKDLMISPVNALLMAMHSDKGDYNSNAYITFQQLQNNKSAIRKGQKGVPFVWESNEYIETNRPDNKISKTEYNNLPKEEKSRFHANTKENLFTLFNIDQTTLPYIYKEDYKQHIELSGKAEQRDDKSLRMEVNKFIGIIKSNLLPIRRDGAGIAFYDAAKDVIHIPPQNVYNSYPEYVQAITREIAHATRVPQRLNRIGLFPSEESKINENLIKDMVSAHKCLEFGLPSNLSKTTLAAIPSIIKKIKESPDFTKNLFADITKTIGMIKKAENGERINVVKQETIEAEIDVTINKGKEITPVKFAQITILKDDDGKWTLVARPEEGKTFAAYPSKQDISAYFDSLKFPNKEEGTKIRTEMAQKYHRILCEHPDLRVNVFKTNAIEENISKIEKVNIFRNRDNKNMLVAYVNNKALQPIELNQSLYQRIWLSDDREKYKKTLAASLYAEKLNQTDKNTTSITQTESVTKDIIEDKSLESKIDLIPCLNEYNRLKKKYPDSILLFRRKDTYIIFSDDALISSEELGLKLTQHKYVEDKNGASLQTTSFPSCELDKYIPNIIKNGHKVVLLDYLEPQEKQEKETTQSEAQEESAKESIKETISNKSSFHR